MLGYYSYDAFGVPTILEDNTDRQIAHINPFLYRSYYYDWEIGMYYLQSRYYDPNLGRFINADEVEFVSMDENLFQYCYNSPVIYEDAYGYSPGMLYTLSKEAAYFFARETYAITKYIFFEVGAYIYQKRRAGKTYYSFTNHVIGSPHNCQIDSSVCKVPKDAKIVGMIHSHPSGGGMNFSKTDKESAQKINGFCYLVYWNNGLNIRLYSKNGGKYTTSIVYKNISFVPLSKSEKMALKKKYETAWKNHVKVCKTRCKFIKRWPAS